MDDKFPTPKRKLKKTYKKDVCGNSFHQYPLWTNDDQISSRKTNGFNENDSSVPNQENEEIKRSDKRPRRKNARKKEIDEKFEKLKAKVNKRLKVEDRIEQLQFITNLNKNLSDQKFIGKEKEIKRCIQILCRKKKRNPLIIGESGVGKTHFVEEIAKKINIGNVPQSLKGINILSLDTGAIVAGTKFRGEFEGRLKSLLNLMEEANREKIKYILFIDEAQNIMGLGSAEGCLDGGSILKPKLTGSKIQCIGAITPSDYRKSFRKDTALSRRFTGLNLEEPTTEETILILNGIKDEFESYYNITIEENIVEEIVTLSNTYIKDKFSPDKAIDILDESCSRFIVSNESTINESKSENIYLKQSTIRDVVSEIANIPISAISRSEKEKLSNIKDELSKKVIGQEEAIKSVSSSIQSSRVGLKDDDKPIGVFLFVGQSGMGKTLLAKTLSDAMFGSDKIIRLDMSEYMEKHSLAKIIGSPPGYIGYDEGSCFAEKIKKKPYSVVLLDEIEKAHSEILNILLQIFDEGRLTDSMGRLIDFRNTIIIMTSNIAAPKIIGKKSLGFHSDSELSKSQNVKSILQKEIQKTFSPEFVNRIDEIIYFNKLSKKNVESIFDLEFAKVKAKMNKQKYFLQANKTAKYFICGKGYSEKYGARPIVRSIKKYIEVPLAEKILNDEIAPNSTVLIKNIKGEDFVKFNTKKRKGEKNGGKNSTTVPRVK